MTAVLIRASRALFARILVVLAMLPPPSVARAQHVGDARVAATEARTSPRAMEPLAIRWDDTVPRPRYSPADAFTVRLTLGGVGMALGTLGGFAIARAACTSRDSDGGACDHVPTMPLALSGAALGSSLGVTTGAHGAGGRRAWGPTLGGAAAAAGLAALLGTWRSSGGAEDWAEFAAFIFGAPGTVIGAMVGNYAGQ